MKRLALIAFSIGLVTLLTPAGALAKGASEATITGPGLGDGITLPGEGQPGGEKLMELADHAGFFAVVFGSSAPGAPKPTPAPRPEGALGPRYVIAYTMPGPNNELDVIRQDLYPYAQLDAYAESAPVTYVKPGQHFFGTETTAGGWWIANPSLKDALVAVGLPKSAPTIGEDGSRAPWVAVTVAAVAACLGVFLVLILRARRRSTPMPA